MSGEIIRKVKTSISSKKGWLSGSIEYEVYSDTISGAENTDVNDILGLPGIPQWGERIGAVRSKGYIQSVQASRNGGDVVNGKYRWSVIATVGSDSSSNNSSSQTPMDQSTISMSVEEIEIYRGLDAENNLNCNSAGEFFEEGLAMKVPIISWTFSGKILNNPNEWITYIKHTNHDTIWGFETDHLLFDSLTYTHAIGSGEWDVQVVIKYNPRKWRELRADVGYYYLDQGTLVRILNEDGSPKESPTPLLPTGAINTTGTLNWKTFFPYGSFNMAALCYELGIPNPLSS